VDLGDQRAGCIEYLEIASGGLLPDRLRNTMGAEDHGGPIGDLAQLINEYRAFISQSLHHETIVHDFMPDIDWSTECLQGTLNNIDGPVNTGTEPTWIGEQHLHSTEL